MVRFDLLLGVAFATLCGLFLLRNADRLAVWYLRLPWAKWNEAWWGVDENWARSSNIIMGWLYMITAACFLLSFIAVNIHQIIAR